MLTNLLVSNLSNRKNLIIRCFEKAEKKKDNKVFKIFQNK